MVWLNLIAICVQAAKLDQMPWCNKIGIVAVDNADSKKRVNENY